MQSEDLSHRTRDQVKRYRYYVTTWDEETQSFKPQIGVRTGPYTLFGLRKAFRLLAGMGYDTGRDSPCVHVEREDKRVPALHKKQKQPNLFE